MFLYAFVVELAVTGEEDGGEGFDALDEDVESDGYEEVEEEKDGEKYEEGCIRREWYIIRTCPGLPWGCSSFLIASCRASEGRSN